MFNRFKPFFQRYLNPWLRLMLGLGLLLPQGVQAQALSDPTVPQSSTVFTTSSFLDTVDANPGNGVCADASGQCTLRAAVMEANAWPGADQIILAAGTYTLSLAGPTDDTALTGDLDVIESLTVQGTGEATTVLDGNQIDRLFQVATESVHLAVNALTIQNGNGGADYGGGIFVWRGSLTTDHVIFLHNKANSGGALAFTDGDNFINYSKFIGNFNDGWYGGAIYNIDSDVSINDSEFIENSTSSWAPWSASGGGLTNEISGRIQINRSIFLRNRANETNGGYGGAILNAGQMEIHDTAILSNVAGIAGGVINASGGTISITNSTLAYNSSSEYGGAFVQGDPIEPAPGGAFIIRNSTIVSNSAGAGGGFYDASLVDAQIENSLFAYNTDSQGASDCNGSLDSLGYNLMRNAQGCTLTGDLTGVLTDVEPGLGALENYSGNLLTFPLIAGSPAIDAGSATNCPDHDQRNFPRPTDGNGDGTAQCDIGAYEKTALPTNTCFATPNDGATVFSSADSQAVRDAVGAVAPNSIVKLAGYCPGVQAQGGTTQTVLITKTLTLAGGYTLTNWLTPDYALNPTTLDALGQGRVVSASVEATLMGFTVTKGYISGTVGGGGFDALGGGIYAAGALTLSQMMVYSNTATGPLGTGGGAYISGTAILTGTTFSGNLGGGAGFEGVSTLVNTIFINNTSNTYDGGGAAFFWSATLINSKFISNTTSQYGGGVVAYSSITVVNTIFADNMASVNGGGAYFWSGLVALTSTTFSNNLAQDQGGGAYFFNTVAKIKDTTFIGNIANAEGGGAWFFYPPALAETSFISNTAGNRGGGVFSRGMVLTNIRFIGNNAQQGGGAYLLYGYSLANTLFANNMATNKGAAIYVEYAGPLKVIHTTIASSVPLTTSAIYITTGTVSLTNTLIASHTVGIENISGTVYADYGLFDSVPTPYSGTVLSGGHSLTGTAAFVNPAAGDYRLSAGSAAIDAGVDAGVFTDFDGDARPQGSGFDLGFDEFVATPATCFATPNDGATVFSSADSQAVRDAVGAVAPNSIVKLAGYCPGVQAQGGTTQTVLITKTLTLAGGYTLTNWLTPDYTLNPTTLDALGQGRVVNAVVPINLYGLSLEHGSIIDNGGGLSVTGNGLVNLSSVQFVSNSASLGGGAFFSLGISVFLTDTSFLQNAGGQGGGLFSFSYLTATNVNFYANTASIGGGANFGGVANGKRTTLTGATFISNVAEFSGGGAIFHNQAVLSSTIFESNVSRDSGGGAAFRVRPATLTNTVFSKNTAIGYGGGAHFQTSADLTNVVFEKNSAQSGGGLWISGDVQLTNVLLADNSAHSEGAGITVFRNGRFIHTTIASSLPITTSALYIATGTVFLTNTLIASHTVGLENISGTVYIDYSLFDSVPTPYSGTVLSGGHLLTGTAAFVNPAAGDYHLTANSAARDAGVDAGVAIDFGGVPRPQGLGFDIGAFEYHSGASLTCIYAYAGDNPSLSTMNLDAYFYEFMLGLQTATRNDALKTCVVLVDHAAAPDAVFKVQNGFITNITDQWPAMPHEVAITNGATVGGFGRWARTTFPAQRTTFTFVGHGMYDAFETDWPAWSTEPPIGPRTPADYIPMPPWEIGGGPNLTDQAPTREMLSIYDLSEMLRIATDDGAHPLDVVDLLLCFQLSVENAYALRQYAVTLVGDPNYVYFNPAMAGVGLSAIAGSQTPEEMASSLANSEDGALPNEGHPRVTAAISTAGLELAKDSLDALARALVTGLNTPNQRAAYRTALRNAYRATVHYDTNCDFETHAPDAVVDAANFLEQLSAQFAPLSEVNMTALRAMNDLNRLILVRHTHSGSPWFKPNNPNAYWNFDAAQGLSLFADLQGYPNAIGQTVLNGVFYWYSSVKTRANPHPYAFVTDKTYGYAWDDVLQAYWRGARSIATRLCLPDFPAAREAGEIVAEGLPLPLPYWPQVGRPTPFEIQFATVYTLHNPLGQITVTNPSGAVVFTNTFGLDFRLPGTYRIRPTNVWTPTQRGVYTVFYYLDTRNQVIEDNEQNNAYTTTLTVGPPRPVPAITAQVTSQLVATPTVGVRVTATVGAPTHIDAVYYRYIAGTHPNTLVPMPVFTQTLRNPTLPGILTFTLPAPQTAGLYEVVLWPYQAGAYGEPVKLSLNYLPPNTLLAAGAEDFYRFTTQAGDALTLTLNTNATLELYVWSPSMPWMVRLLTGGGTVHLTPAEAGAYVVSVRNPTGANTTYTLTALRNGGPLHPEVWPTAELLWVARPRPTFAEPLAMPAPEYPLYLPFVVR